MITFGIGIVAVVSIVAMVVALGQPGGCLRYSFLCGTLYLTWIVPQLFGLNADDTTPENGLSWLVVMVLLCLGASLVGWRIGIRRRRRAMPPAIARIRTDVRPLFWPAAALTAFIFALHVMIGMQPIEARQQGAWSGPLTIIAFFLSLSVIGLYLSLLIALRERSTRAFILAGANVLLSGMVAFIALRRGELVDFGVATAAALWFGVRKRIPLSLVATAIIGMVMVAYAITPLRIAAKEAARTESGAGLLSPEVWRQVDFAGAVQKSSQQAIDLSNAVHIIDSTNRWNEFTLGQRSWDRFVFQWVPAQILGADFKNGLMFEQGTNYEQIQLDYAFTYIGGTTSTGFGFAYQEFGPFGFIYFLSIGILMGRLWSRAETGDVWAQALYVSFAGGALLSVTHHAMWLIVKIPLFLLAVFGLKRMSRRSVSRRFSAGYTPLTR